MKYFVLLLLCPILLFGESNENERFKLINLERDTLDDSFIVEIKDQDYGWVYLYRFGQFQAEFNLWEIENDLMFFMIWNRPERIICLDKYD